MLRPEARPANWSTLDEGQREAFRKILGMIEAAVADLPTPGARPVDPAAGPALSADRSSRIAFLDGGRGTGKSTVLTSLIGATRQNNATRQTQVDEAIRDQVARVRNRLVWLEPLDLEPLSESMNLLAAILVRVDFAMQPLARRVPPLETWSEESGRRESSGLLAPHVGSDEPLMRLQRLQSRFTLAWDGNLQERRGSLDADSYAVEVLRAETAGLRVNAQVDDVLEGLAKALSENTRLENPIFVLPVDDFDLNPTKCLDLLRLLRMISVPRLFALVLGDLRVAEMVLRLKVSRDFGKAGKDALTLPIPEKEIAAMVADVAANASRKLLPPTQRISLASMSLLEALNFRPLGPPDDHPRLFELLAAVDFGRSVKDRRFYGWKIGNLCEFLLAKGVSILVKRPAVKIGTEPLTDKHTAHTAYSALDFLAAPPRRVTDLWLQFKDFSDANEREVVSSPPWSEVVGFFARYSNNLLSQDPALSSKTRSETEQAIRRRSSTGQWEIGVLPLEVRPLVELIQLLDGKPITIREPSKIIEGKNTFRPRHRLCRHCGWRFEADGSALKQESGATLSLFHDLLALDGEAAESSSQLLGGGDDFYAWATTEWTVPGQDPVMIPWPTPPCVTFWDYDIFLTTWTDVIDWLHVEMRREPTVHSSNFEDLVFTWIAVGTAALDGKYPVKRGNWGTLKKRLQGLSDNIRDDFLAEQRSADWLAEVAAFLMPDGGLPPSIVKKLDPEELLSEKVDAAGEGEEVFGEALLERFRMACSRRLRVASPDRSYLALIDAFKGTLGSMPPALVDTYRKAVEDASSRHPSDAG